MAALPLMAVRFGSTTAGSAMQKRYSSEVRR